MGLGYHETKRNASRLCRKRKFISWYLRAQNALHIEAQRREGPQSFAAVLSTWRLDGEVYSGLTIYQKKGEIIIPPFF